MSDFLVDHAVKYVWCDPEQDFQHILKPTRITDPRGVRGEFDLLWRSVQLPTATDKYHVYQIGQVFPEALGLLGPTSQWMRLSDVVAQTLVYIQVYTTEGLVFPLTESYILFTRDRTLVIAVKEQPGIAPLRTTPLYFRFYSNAYFASQRSAGDTNTLAVRFYRHTTTVAALDFQARYNTWRAKPGFTALYRNGQYVQSFLPNALAVGDVLEFIYDSSVKQVVDFPIVNLQTFDSDLDLKRKYLLHYPGAQAGDVSIDYRDDIDVFLFKPTVGNPNNAFNGVYFHKNQNDAFRQLTHRDYAVTVPYVAAYQDSQPDWGDITQLTLRLVIRHAGYDRPLVYDSHHIQELYKLAEGDLVNAFLGIGSNVDVWRAPALEASDYIKVMDARYGTLTRAMVEGAYGYNAIAKLLGDTPQLVPSAGNYLQLPPGLWQNATVYEYDSNGLLLGHYPHTLGVEYAPVFAGAAMVEGRVGTGALTLDQVMGQNDIPLDPALSYRFYLAPIVDGSPDQSAWQDVTGDNTKYMVVNGKAHWLVDTNAYLTCVKSDKAFLAYDLLLATTNGLLKFSIHAQSSYPDGVRDEVLRLPVGQLDLWLNGHALIENVDYYVQWPEVVLVNKAFLVAGSQQKITVRGTGFCNADLTRPGGGETAFIRWGVLSHNDRFNLRDDKVVRIVANGRLFARSQVAFSEDLIQASLPGVPNGAPYAVTDVVVPLRGFTDQDTYTLLAPAKVNDQQISDYLTLKLPDRTPAQVDIIPQKYAVYSPFVSTLLHDLVNGVLLMDQFKQQYSDKDVKDALVNYTYLLQYDPTLRGVDLLHVEVQPHNLTVPMELTLYQYNFLRRAIHIYLDDKVDLTDWVIIQSNWT